MQDRPTSAELLEALEEFMRDRSSAARDRWERFQFLVAANSLAILRRETEMEDDFVHAEWAGLDALMGVEGIPARRADMLARLNERNAEFGRRIRAGEFDGEREPALLDHLYETVLNKVRIANPAEAR